MPTLALFCVADERTREFVMKSWITTAFARRAPYYRPDGGVVRTPCQTSRDCFRQEVKQGVVL